MNTFFLDALQQYGYPVLWLIVFIASAGIPISGSLLLFASGAFAAFGDFNIILLLPITLSAAVMGDNLTYLIGRRVGVALLSWLDRQKRFRFISSNTMQKGMESFRRRAAWTIFITRFLLVGLGGPINLVAGLEQYPYPRFLLWDVCGQILGVIIPIGLGYVFAQSWEEVASIFGAVSSLLIALLVALFLGVMLLRNVRQKQRIKQEETVKKQETYTPQPLLDTLEQNINTTSASD